MKDYNDVYKCTKKYYSDDCLTDVKLAMSKIEKFITKLEYIEELADHGVCDNELIKEFVMLCTEEIKELPLNKEFFKSFVFSDDYIDKHDLIDIFVCELEKGNKDFVISLLKQLDFNNNYFIHDFQEGHEFFFDFNPNTLYNNAHYYSVILLIVLSQLEAIS